MSWTSATLGGDELCPRSDFAPLTEKRGQCALSVTVWSSARSGEDEDDHGNYERSWKAPNHACGQDPAMGMGMDCIVLSSFFHPTYVPYFLFPPFFSLSPLSFFGFIFCFSSLLLSLFIFPLLV